MKKKYTIASTTHHILLPLLVSILLLFPSDTIFACMPILPITSDRNLIDIIFDSIETLFTFIVPILLLLAFPHLLKKKKHLLNKVTYGTFFIMYGVFALCLLWIIVRNTLLTSEMGPDCLTYYSFSPLLPNFFQDSVTPILFALSEVALLVATITIYFKK